MKLLYATTITFPSTRANRIQVLAMARAFSKILGGNFLLGVSTVDSREPLGVPHVAMGVSRSFIMAWRYIFLARKQHFTHIYCREEKLLFFMISIAALLRMRTEFYYELHHLAYINAWWHRSILRHVSGIVSITAAMTEPLRKEYAGPVYIAPDGVAVELFDIARSRGEARRTTSLPLDKHIALYAGAIDEPWKGAGVFYEAAKQFDDTYLFIIVGGKPHYIEEFNQNYPPISNVRMEGYKDYTTELPIYLKAADVLVVPNSAKVEISRISTSPLKVFAYMAAGVPIVASDLPSIREVLNDSNAILVAPDDAGALAKGIRTAVSENTVSLGRAAQALRDVGQHTWDNRAHAILSFMNNRDD